MTSLRRVRHVALRAPSEALVRRGVTLLEDALRTASWTLDRPGSLVVVRRFDVGAIDPDESPSALSLRIEARLRALSARVVAARAAEAPRAEAVRFETSLEPAVMLAEHAARTSAAPPWFLLRAIPSARVELGPAQWLRAALAAAIEVSPAGPAALVEALLATRSANALFTVIEARDGQRLLATLGLSASRFDAPSATVELPLDDGASVSENVTDGRTEAPLDLLRDPTKYVSAEFFETLSRRVIAWGVDDARSRWLASLALLSRTPSMAASPRFTARVRALLDAVVSVARTPVATRTLATLERPHAAPTPALSTAGCATAYGAMLFFVSLMARLGMADFLDAHPSLAEAAFPLHLLEHLARRLDVPLDDPALVALGAPEMALPATPVTPPDALVRLAGSPAITPREGARTHPAVALFHTALRRVVRRGARVGLRAMVERPARVWTSRTHIDVAFDMRRVHLGLRRIGADVDPGFVPWLGRVIHFHYRIGEEPRD